MCSSDLDSKKIHLIVGGYDKQVDLTLLTKQSERVACMYAIGATRDAIAKRANGRVRCFEIMQEAVRCAKSEMQEGDVLLLSPGCASWDQFDNYEQRGDLFCKLVT